MAYRGAVGVDGIPVYEMLEARGFTAHLVNGPEEYAQRARAREIAHLRHKATKLGLTLVECPA